MLKFNNPFHEEPSLEELQEREERRTLQLSIAQKDTLIKKLEAEGRKWQEFSASGKKDDNTYMRIMQWLRGTKSGKKTGVNN